MNLSAVPPLCNHFPKWEGFTTYIYIIYIYNIYIFTRALLLLFVIFGLSSAALLFCDVHLRRCRCRRRAQSKLQASVFQQSRIKAVNNFGLGIQSKPF